MYLLLNADQTINFIDDHPVNESLLIKHLSLIEYPEKDIADVLGDIPIEQAIWDDDNKKIIQQPIFNEDSIKWRQLKASQRINEHYPMTKQVNLLRSGDKSALKKMALFIDKCRKWSNELSIGKDVIYKISP